LVLLVYEREYARAMLSSASLFIALYYALRYVKEVWAFEEEKAQFVWLCMGWLMLVLPLLFVVRDAFSSGNTTSLTHRYIGNASPFVVILVAVGMVRAAGERWTYAVLLLFAGLYQWRNIQGGLEDYFADRSV